MNAVPPLRREVLVAGPPELAYEVFTEHIGEWWPVDRLSVYGASAQVHFEDDDIVETGPDGQRSVWGSVTSRRPGQEIAFTWHPGREPAQTTQVTVTFAASGEQTLVRLVHEGWEVFANPTGARTEYGNGWPTVLELYRHNVERTAA